MRVFIAIDLPENVRREIISIQKEIDKLGLVRGKFTDPEKLHLTLKFLGEVSRSEFEAVKEKIECIKFDKFDVSLGEIGVFSEDFVRIIWVKLDGQGVLDLQKRIDEALKDIFPPEYRFMSHVTIARPKSVEDKKILIDEMKKISFNKLNFSVDKLIIKKSDLTKEGPIYTNLSVSQVS